MAKRKTGQLTLHVNLRPKGEFPPKIQSAFWRRVLDIEFRTSIGKPRTDHVVSGATGDSHVEYEIGGMTIIIYDVGYVTIEDDNFDVGKSGRVESILDSILATVRRTMTKPVNFELSAYIHTIAKKSIERFLSENIRFSPTRQFIKVFADSKVRSIILHVSRTLSIMLVTPNHIDFLYHSTISTKPDRKPFVSNLTKLSMKYLNSLSRLT